MNIEKLKEEIQSLGISSRAYSLSGGLPNEKYCLSKEAAKWSVYYSERGQRSGEKEFKKEHDACIYILGLLKNDPTTRL